jgi:pyruvate dehydrogenase E2 component (dihydrolipoamide acetyltransferase)
MAELNMKKVSLSPLRKIISQRMTESFKIPQYNLQTDIDMENIINVRNKMDPNPSVTACLIWACAGALKKRPELNGYFIGNELCLITEVNIGVAASLPEGLIVPVIKNADQKSLPQIAAELKVLVGNAEQKKLSPDDMQDGTFTVSNLGMYQVKSFNPLINPPQLAILGIGGLQTSVKLVGETIKEYKYINVTLTADHRVIDGAIAAQFLNVFKDNCQSLTKEAAEQ